MNANVIENIKCFVEESFIGKQNKMPLFYLRENVI